MSGDCVSVGARAWPEFCLQQAGIVRNASINTGDDTPRWFDRSLSNCDKAPLSELHLSCHRIQFISTMFLGEPGHDAHGSRQQTLLASLTNRYWKV